MTEYVILLQLLVLSVNYVYQRKNENRNLKCLTTLLSLLTAIVASLSLIQQLSAPVAKHSHIYNFLSIKHCEFELLSDSLSIVSAWIVCTITAIANFYSTGYVKKNLADFLFCINLFSLTTVLFSASGNLLQMFVFWEALTIVSYLLTVGNRDFSLKSAFKLVVTHKFGDVGFIIATVMIFDTFGSFDFSEINKFFIGNDILLKKMEIISLIMLASILVKSAQIGSTSWLRNTMFAPLPAAALIHSATLPTAGIIVIIRLQNLFECSELIQNTVIRIGMFCMIVYSIKAIFAGSIEKMFAYSTCSQIGLMTAACGFSAYGAAEISFVSHAFSKAALIFAMGSVVHALSGEQNIKSMGGLFELLPKTYIAFVLIVASSISIPLLPAYYAKKVLLNEIIGSNLSVYYVAIILIVIASFFANICFFRMIYVIFHGEIKLTETELAYLNEDEKFITYSLYASVFLAIFSGVFFYYAAYNDVVWNDFFAFLYTEDEPAVFAFSVINFVGTVAAGLICKSVKPQDFSLRFDRVNSDIVNALKKLCVSAIKNTDTKFYQKCYLFIAKKSR
jgi:NADH-quinone oxidoreductase subunit L